MENLDVVDKEIARGVFPIHIHHRAFLKAKARVGTCLEESI